jgi:hypothetical protein
VTRRLAAALAGAALLLGACDPHGTPAAHSTTHQEGHARPSNDPHGTPTATHNEPHVPNTQPGQVALFVTWKAESRTKPICEWSRDGAVHQCADLEDPEHQGAGGWVGTWEHAEMAKTGTKYYLSAQGTNAVTSIICEISWKGQVIPGITNGQRCSVSFQLN